MEIVGSTASTGIQKYGFYMYIVTKSGYQQIETTTDDGHHSGAAGGGGGGGGTRLCLLDFIVLEFVDSLCGNIDRYTSNSISISLIVDWLRYSYDLLI